MGQGRGGSGPGTGAGRRGKSGSGAGGAGGSSSGGSSSGSSGSGGKGSSGAGTGGVTGGGGGSGSGGGGSSTTTPAGGSLRIEFGAGLSGAERDKQQALFDRLPDRLKKVLHDRGTKVWVGTSADKTPGWSEFSKRTGATSDTKIGDGRKMGTLSFFSPATNELFVSVHHPGGSVNVYTHELGHALDYEFLDGPRLAEWPPGSGDFTSVRIISSDPEWVDLHTKYVLNNPNINSYYRGGPTGTISESGRKELFAEGFAVYNEFGRDVLANWVKSSEAADKMIAIWKKYGVFE